MCSDALVRTAMVAPPASLVSRRTFAGAVVAESDPAVRSCAAFRSAATVCGGVQRAGLPALDRESRRAPRCGSNGPLSRALLGSSHAECSARRSRLPDLPHARAASAASGCPICRRHTPRRATRLDYREHLLSGAAAAARHRRCPMSTLRPLPTSSSRSDVLEHVTAAGRARRSTTPYRTARRRRQAHLHRCRLRSIPRPSSTSADLHDWRIGTA